MRINSQIFEARLQIVNDLYAKGHTIPAIAEMLNLKEHQVKHCIYRDAQNASVDKYFEAHPDKITERYYRLKALWLSPDETCTICGAPAKVRHHRVYGEKEFAFKELYINNANIEKIEAEKAKTIPLCISCHRKLHLGIIIRPDLYSGPIQKMTYNGPITEEE